MDCKSCSKPIRFIVMGTGKRMPVDAGLAERYEDGLVITSVGDVGMNGGFGWRPHWAS